MKIAVTGAAGRVGRATLQELKDAGHTVWALDRTLPPPGLAQRALLVDLSDAGAVYGSLAGAIVFYNMLLSCFLDIGETRQRRPTEALIIFMCVLGVHLWRQSVRASIPGPEAPRLP